MQTTFKILFFAISIYTSFMCRASQQSQPKHIIRAKITVDNNENSFGKFIIPNYYGLWTYNKEEKRKAKSLKLKEAQKRGKLQKQKENEIKIKEEMETQRRKEQLLEEARLAELHAKKLEEENEKRRKLEEDRLKQEMIDQQKFEEEQREKKRIALAEAEKVKEERRLNKQKKIERKHAKINEADIFAKHNTQIRLFKLWLSNAQENKRERELEAQASIVAQKLQKIRALKSFQKLVDSHKMKKALTAAMQKKANDFNTALQIKRNKSIESRTFIRWLDLFCHQQEFKKAVEAKAKLLAKKRALKDKEREFKERRERALVLNTYEHWKREHVISSYSKIVDRIETQASDFYNRKLQQKIFKALHLNVLASKKQADEFAKNTRNLVSESATTPKPNTIRILGPMHIVSQPVVQPIRFQISPLLAEELARCLHNYKQTCAELGCPQDQFIIDSHNQLAQFVVANERTPNKQLKLFRFNRKAIDKQIRQQIAAFRPTAATAYQPHHVHAMMPCAAQINNSHNHPVKNNAASSASTVSVQFQKLVTLNYKDQFNLERDKYMYAQLSSHQMIKQREAIQNAIKDELRALTNNISIYKENMADELEKFKKNASSIIDQHENRLKREMGAQKINTFMQNRVLKNVLQKWKNSTQSTPGKSQLPESNSHAKERTKPIHAKTNSDHKHANENASPHTISPALAQKHNQPFTIFDAIRADSQTAVSLFIIQGAINSRDHEGKTPLYRAIADDKVGMVGFLLDHDADMSIRDNRRVSTSDLIRSPEMARMINKKMREVIARKTGQAHVWLIEKRQKNKALTGL